MNTVTVISIFYKSETPRPCPANTNLNSTSSLPSRSEINVKSTSSTLVVWLQNDNGYNMYKPSDAAIDAFLESYRPGRDKNTETVVSAENTITSNNSNSNNNNSTENNKPT
jgi:hypothetical protein